MAQDLKGGADWGGAAAASMKRPGCGHDRDDGWRTQRLGRPDARTMREAVLIWYQPWAPKIGGTKL